MNIRNHSELGRNPSRRKAMNIIDSGLEAIKTERIMRKKVRRMGKFLLIEDAKGGVSKINLDRYKRITVIGFGKASSLMAKEIEKILDVDDGLVISNKKVKLKKIEVIKGTHPMPSRANISATKKMIALLEKLEKDNLVLCLVSGGGSALLCYPKIDFKSYLRIIEESYKSGIEIQELNKIRKRLSHVKGGKLVRFTKAKIVSLIFSDVIGDDLATIASGPTAAKGADNILILNNTVALSAMKEKAEQLGLRPYLYSSKVRGEARAAGKKIAGLFRKSRYNCMLFAGETTVTLTGKGKGGRSQEFVLGAIEELSRFDSCALISIGTDGKDGSADAAGAIADEHSLRRSRKLKLDINYYQENNATDAFFKKMNDRIVTGLTGSNMADIGVMVKEG